MENEEKIGITLLKKGKKGIMSFIFSRSMIVSLALILQFVLLGFILFRFQRLIPHYYGISVIISVSVILYLLNNRMNPSVKITWFMVVMLLPIFGTVFFIFTQSDFGHMALKKRINRFDRAAKDVLQSSSEVLDRLRCEDAGVYALSSYINRDRCHPVFENTEVKYFPLGEDKFSEMIVQLEKAEKFIFMEYFIVEEGEMWGRILEVLTRKAREGVEIRFMYDGSCEFTLLPHKYPRMLGELGIKCKVFSPATPFLSTHYNYRDHRKILVIDGKVAFTGGVNLADEYINKKLRFGHWKDTAVMICGEAVSSFTLMFLQMWELDEKKVEIDKYIRASSEIANDISGYVIPYGDCPLDNDKVGEMVYIDILNRAKDHVYIMTPYLILDGEMETAIKFASERGVDVTLILPGIPDKRIPYALAKTYYSSLLESGVKILEYTPGFVHAKVFVSDNREAVVGTINLDYRSLYHHFECATYMYGSECIKDIELDFSETAKKCRTVSRETVKKEKPLTKLVGYCARAIAPLL